MSLYDKLTNDMSEARRGRNKHKLRVLSYIVGVLSGQAVLRNGVKVVDDTKAIKTLEKCIQNEEDLMKKGLSYDRHVIDILPKYVPQKMSEKELTTAIEMLYSTGSTTIGEIMRALKESGQSYDGKLASKIAKDITSK